MQEIVSTGEEKVTGESLQMLEERAAGEHDVKGKGQEQQRVGQVHSDFNVIMGLSQKQGGASWRTASRQHRLRSTSQS